MCHEGVAFPPTEVKREDQGHLDLGGYSSDSPEKSEGQRWLAGLSRSREREKGLHWGCLELSVVRAKNTGARWVQEDYLKGKHVSAERNWRDCGMPRV